MEILLLTASINAKLASPIYTNLIDTDERLSQYKNTLKRYIEESSFDKLVFCENTGFDFSKDQLIDLAKDNYKEIEFLTFVSDIESVSKYGKGFGEGECIEYALKHSIYLQQDSICFFKVTGRLFIKNINEILLKNQKHKNCFYTDGINSSSVRTEFFKAQVFFFNQNLLSVYKNVNDSENKFLEYIYFENLIDKKVNGMFPYPFIIGNSGSTGNAYLISNEYKKAKYLNDWGFYSLNKTYYDIKKMVKKIISLVKKKHD